MEHERSLLDRIRQDLEGYIKANDNVIAVNLLTRLVKELEGLKVAGTYCEVKALKVIEKLDMELIACIKALKANVPLATVVWSKHVTERETLKPYLPIKMAEQEIREIISLYVDQGFEDRASIIKRFDSHYSGKYDELLLASVVSQKLLGIEN